jgi:hypothetical protein
VIARWRAVFPHWSERTLRDFIRALSLLSNSGDRAVFEAVRAAARRDGTISVRRLLLIARRQASSLSANS